MTRWRMPPESLCGYSSMRRSGRGNVHAPQQFDRTLARRSRRDAAAMPQDGLDDLIADGEARIERGHRFLENHRQTVAAEVAQSLVGHLQKIEAVETDRAGNLGGVFRQQAHDRERGHALAAAGFADQPKRRALGDAEIDAIDRMGSATVVAVKNDPQVPDVDQRDVGHFRSALAALMLAVFNACVDGLAIGNAGRIAAGRQIFPEMHPALAAHLFEAFEFGQRIGVIVDAQIERRPFLVAVNQNCRRLPAALVAAGGLAGAHRRDQALRERQICMGDVGVRGVVQHAGHRPAYCRRSRNHRP
jgi:hypothetical protein